MSSGDKVGAYTLAAPYGFWGGGFFCARDDEGKRVVLQRAFGRETGALHFEAAWRLRHPHANMPAVVGEGISPNPPFDPNAHAWLAYAAVAAVPVEHALGVHPVPVVLSWAAELVEVMRHHARCAAETGHSVELRPAFADLLVTSEGTLLVLTVPSPARTWHNELLRSSRLDHSLRAPELGIMKQEPIAARLDVFAVGGFVREMLREGDEPRRDISARTAALVARALGPLDGRHESLDELAHDVRACLDEFPPLDPTDRARAARSVAGEAMAEVEKELSQ